MQILYSRCCGIDVHKDSVTVCVLIYSGQPGPEMPLNTRLLYAGVGVGGNTIWFELFLQN